MRITWSSERPDSGLRNDNMDVKAKMKEMSKELDAPIKSYIEDELPSNLIEAARQYPYAGGKRMRPTMVVAACGAVGGDKKKAARIGQDMAYHFLRGNR